MKSSKLSSTKPTKSVKLVKLPPVKRTKFYEIEWKALKSKYKNLEVKTGTFYLSANTEEQAKKEFLLTHNLAGQKYKVTSIEEIP